MRSIGTSLGEGDQSEGIVCLCKSVEPVLGEGGHKEGIWTVKKK